MAPAREEEWHGTYTNRAAQLHGHGVVHGMAVHDRLLHLVFFKGLLAIVLWPYYLGVAYRTLLAR